MNEFGALPIDAELIEARGEKVIAIAGGCVCCSYGSDLMAALMDLEEIAGDIDHVLIETSGVALPGQVARSVGLLAGYAHDATVILADGETVRQRAGDQYLSDTIANQLESADIVLLNKSDLLAPGELDETRAWLATAAPEARVVETRWARIDKAALLGAGSGRLATAGRGHHAVELAAAEFELAHPVDAERLAAGLSAAGLGLIRAKGVVRGRDGEARSVQVVARRWRVEKVRDGLDGPGRLVCIAVGEAIDEVAIRALIDAAELFQ